MPTPWDIIGGISTIVDDIFGSARFGYNIYQDQRDFAQQQRQFEQSMNFARESRDIQLEREDTAIQRRAADLEAAGINKRLAAGQPAASGGYGTGPGMGRAGGEQMQGKPSPNLQNALLGLQARQMDLSNQQTLADIERLREVTREQAAKARIAEQQADFEAESQEHRRREQMRMDREQQRADQRLTIEQRREQRESDKFQYEVDVIRNQVESGNITNQMAYNRLEHQWMEFRQAELDHYSAELRNSAMELGITTDQLKNGIISHDLRILRNSQFRSDYDGRQVDTENFLRTIIPGNSEGARRARQILQPILELQNEGFDRLLNIIRSLNRINVR